MTFSYLPDTVWYILIALFVIFYVAYVVRLKILSGRLKTDTGTGNSIFKLILRLSYFGLMLFALLGPSFGAMKQEVKVISKDIFVAVDLSASMNAGDIVPTRLSKVKFELKNLISKLGSNRIGLVIFSSQAFVQCPLTYDQGALSLFIETLHTGLVPSSGTDFSKALEMIEGKFEQDREDNPEINSSQIALVISDGEDFSENLGNVLEAYEEKNIPVYTLGVGTSEGIQLREQTGRVKTDRSGAPVVSRLTADNLKKIARRTGGGYFEITKQLNEAPQLVQAIEEVRGQLRESRQVDVNANKYYYFLIAALLLAVVDGVTTVSVLKI